MLAARTELDTPDTPSEYKVFDKMKISKRYWMISMGYHFASLVVLLDTVCNVIKKEKSLSVDGLL